MRETLHEADLFAGGPVWGGVHRLNHEVFPHAHDFVEIAVIGSGTGRHRSSAGARRVRHGQVVVLRPGAWHAFEECNNLVVANCCISAQALRTELAGLQQIPVLREVLWTAPIAHGPHGLAVFQTSQDAADEAIEHISQLEGSQPIGRLLGRLVTVLGLLADGRTDQQTPEPLVHPAVTATVARFEAALADTWRLDDIAKAVNLDAAYLSRLFRKHTGLSPLGYLARLRAEHAATLLTHSDLPAARVGAAVGWPDPTYFARRFRTLVGSTPTEYRTRSGR